MIPNRQEGCMFLFVFSHAYETWKQEKKEIYNNLCNEVFALSIVERCFQFEKGGNPKKTFQNPGSVCNFLSQVLLFSGSHPAAEGNHTIPRKGVADLKSCRQVLGSCPSMLQRMGFKAEQLRILLEELPLRLLLSKVKPILCGRR